ncbi:MAG: T9SS type A sorting domain-containing protein [Chitinophagaceae bacterium]
MKKIYFLTLILLAAVTGWSQATYTWIGNNNASWQTAASWSPARTTPAATDILLFNAGNTRTITNFPTTQTVGRIHVSNNTNIRLQAPTFTQTLTIGDGSGDDFIIEAGSFFTQDQSMNEIRLAVNATANIAGTYTIENGVGFYLTNSGAVATVTGTIINSNGAINSASAIKLIFNGGTYVHDINGGTIPTAAWNAGSTLDMAGVTNSWPAGTGQTFVNVRVADITGNTTIGSNFTCTGDFTVAYTANADLRINNGSSNTAYTLSVGNYIQSAGNFIITSNDGNGGGNLNVAGDFSLSGGNFMMRDDNGTVAGFNVAGNYSQSGGTFYLRDATSGTSTANVTGNVLMTAGTMNFSNLNNQTGTLNVGGNFTHSAGTFTETGNGSSNGVINFNGTSVQTYSRTSGTNSNTLTYNITNGAAVDFGSTGVITGTGTTFNVNAGGKLITSHANGVNSTGSNGSIQTNTRTFNAGADYEFRGASTGVFNTTGGASANDVRDLIINNTSGQVSMAKNFTITRALTLTNGYVTPGANTLLVGTAGTSTSSNGAYVNGQLSKQFNNATGFTFYVGKVSGGLRSIGFTPTSGTGTSTFVAEFLRTSGATVGSVYGSGISRVSQCEYWTLNRNAGGNRIGRVTLSWNANSNCGTAPYVTSLGTLRVARHDGTAWTNAGSINGADLGSSLTSGFITSDVVNNFSPFALATSNAAENPLPVMFADVKAYSKNNGVQVEWSNLTEREILNYEVERSANGIDFYAVNQQLPKSNRDDKASYTFFDASPVNGANYYRVRVQEQTGKVIYSKILRVEMGSTKYSFSLYPNPVTGKQLTVSLNGVKQGKYNVQIIDAAGQRVFTTNLSNVGTGVTQMIELPANVKTGMYMMIVNGDNYRETQQFIVR